MFKQTQIKLTLFYSGLFLVLFWLFSLSLYFWMDRSFGEGYISQVKQRQQAQYGQNQGEYNDTKTVTVTIAGDVALSQLQNILLMLNGGFLIIIPIASWFLAKRTLLPVQSGHERQKQFVSDVSHELRTPLSIMSGEIEVALNKRRAAEDYKHTLVSTKDELDRLTMLVENLLFLAREDRSNTQIYLHDIDITDVVSSVLVKFKPKFTEKKIMVHFHPPHESTTVLGQKSMLYQLFANLIENAIKFSPYKGSVDITFSRRKDIISIHIADNGRGIDIKDQTKIFNRFYRTDSSRSETKGYGLGLAICKAIVNRHQGSIAVQSALGKGSIFTVMLRRSH